MTGNNIWRPDKTYGRMIGRAELTVGRGNASSSGLGGTERRLMGLE